MGDIKALFISFAFPGFNDTIRNNFDFLKQGGFLVAPPIPTPRLQDVIFTLDLSKLVPSAKNRSDAIDLLVSLRKPIADPPDPPKQLNQNILNAFIAARDKRPESLDSETYACLRKVLVKAKPLTQ